MPLGQHTRNAITSAFTVSIVALWHETSDGFQIRFGTGATPIASKPPLPVSDAASPDGVAVGLFVNRQDLFLGTLSISDGPAYDYGPRVWWWGPGVGVELGY